MENPPLHRDRAFGTKRVIIHHEIYRDLMRQKAEVDFSLQDLVHVALCKYTGRMDLLTPQMADAASTLR